MKRVAAMLLLACALPIAAQTTTQTTTDTSTTTSGTTTTAADAQASTEEPITFSFGPQQDGGFGTVVKGSAYYPLRRFIAPVQDGVTPPLKTVRFGGLWTPSAYLYVSPEVNWSSQTGAQNQYALSARPTFQLGYQKDVSKLPRDKDGLPRLPASLPWQPWPLAAPMFEAYLDVRQHSAQAESASTTAPALQAGETTAPQNGDATFYGAGIGIAVPWISRAIERSQQADPANFTPATFPMLRVTYYRASGASENAPEDIKADQFSASLNFSLPLPEYLNAKPRFDFEGDLSRAVGGKDRDWKSLVKAALLIQLGNSNFKPVLSYTSGEKFGFQYDRQMLLGLAFDFAGNVFQPR